MPKYTCPGKNWTLFETEDFRGSLKLLYRWMLCAQALTRNLGVFGKFPKIWLQRKLQPWSKHLGTVMKMKSENAVLK